MSLGRVTGRVVCARRVEELGSNSLLLVQPVDEAGSEGYSLGVVRAAAGDVIWFAQMGPRGPCVDGPQPVDAVIVGMRDR